MNGFPARSISAPRLPSSRRGLALALAFVGFLFSIQVEAAPHFARRFDLSCNACHSVPPQLNATGLAFKAGGYRLPAHLAQRADPEAGSTTVPFSTWLTARFEDDSGGPSDLFLPKVELIGGGAIGDELSWFAEWRIVSLSLRGDGSLQDRGGRFEDLYLEWSPAPRHALTVGQFRSLNQVDVSRRLSPSEPLLFRNGLFTGSTDSDPRIRSLSRFSPSSRSPGIGYSYRSIEGPQASDGLFHFVTVPFTGELSIPLSREASETASFELTGPPKGVFLETFYRRGLDSYGVHAFWDDESWLATALASLDLRPGLFLTAGFGLDDQDGGPSRDRWSVQLEYLETGGDRLRGGAGLRVEDLSHDGRDEALVPYLVLSGPQTRYDLLLQIEYRIQDDADQLVLDLSAMF